MQRKSRIRVDKLSRFLAYVLGHRPDEFGLVPDPTGFVTLRELLRAIHEEPGWGYVREGDIREVLVGKDRSLFECDGERIRALERRWEMTLDATEVNLPKILYVAVRRRAHAHVMEKGLVSERFMGLAPEPETALRIGRRRDQRPVLLEVLAAPAHREGIPFVPFGRLYLTREVPARFLSGPPVEEQVDRRGKEPKATPKPADFAPGTFVLEARRDPDLSRRDLGRKARGWKADARKLRKRRAQ
ncbi:MAG: RNA 2'-phosphotransferase [Deltaproteobacteria bacterium]|nr:RNA 2'-phosphotransferase [Deltaproteobacteria bacterium]